VVGIRARALRYPSGLALSLDSVILLTSALDNSATKPGGKT
jgi:hypothetical protein